MTLCLFAIIEVFPELCKIHLNISTTEIKRNTTVLQVNHDNNVVMNQGKRWLFLLVVFVYLVISKLIARSTNTTSE